MEVNCEGCAGCCLDWRPLVSDGADHERRGPYTPFDDQYNLVPLTREDVRGFVDDGLADALTPRLWTGEDAPEAVTIDDRAVAAIEGKPVFFLGLRKPSKPVGPFGTDPTWLPTCVFLDPETLQCRIHETERYPAECADYPGTNLALGAETECERVERSFGGERLVDATPPEEGASPRFGPDAIGHTVFIHPEPATLSGVVDRLVDDRLRTSDRAPFAAAAAASAPGSLGSNPTVYEDVFERAMSADSWAGRAAQRWAALATTVPPKPSLAKDVEGALGAPNPPGW